MLSTGNAVPWTRCGRNSVVAISENGPRAVVFREPRLHRERYRCSYFFADCGCSFVEVTICVVFVLAMRSTYSTFAVCNDDCSLFLSANIMDYFARISYRFRYTERHLFHFVDITLINTSCEKNIKCLSFAWISIENGGCSLRMVSYTSLANMTCGTQPLRKFYFFFFLSKI